MSIKTNIKSRRRSKDRRCVLAAKSETVPGLSRPDDSAALQKLSLLETMRRYAAQIITFGLKSRVLSATADRI